MHLITPRLVPVALSAGVTTLITAGFEEPPYVMDKTLRAFEFLPVNLGLQASARTDAPGQVERVLEAGACGLKIHEDWGAYPEIIDATLRLADAARRGRLPAHRRAERVVRAARTPSTPSAAGRSTPTTWRAPAAATSPT